MLCYVNISVCVCVCVCACVRVCVCAHRSVKELSQSSCVPVGHCLCHCQHTLLYTGTWNVHSLMEITECDVLLTMVLLLRGRWVAWSTFRQAVIRLQVYLYLHVHVCIDKCVCTIMS